MTNKISQSTTQFPLLRALAGAPNGELAVDAAVDAALKELGGDPADKAHRTAVGNGKWDLKARGIVSDPTRGTWAITDLGREALASGTLPPQDRDKYLGAPKPRKAGTAPTPDEPAATPAAEPPAMARAEEPAAAPEAPAPEAPAPEAPAPVAAKRRLKVANAPAANAPAADVPAWLNDDDIRALAVASTECFGAWAAKSGECGKCPLAGWCRNAKAATLTLLASKLSTETPAAPSPVTASVAKLDAAVGAANAPSAAKAAPDAGMTLKARVDGICAASGRPIKAGDSIRYLPGFGLYHADETPPSSTVAK